MLPSYCEDLTIQSDSWGSKGSITWVCKILFLLNWSLPLTLHNKHKGVSITLGSWIDLWGVFYLRFFNATKIVIIHRETKEIWGSSLQRSGHRKKRNVAVDGYGKFKSNRQMKSQQVAVNFSYPLRSPPFTDTLGAECHCRQIALALNKLGRWLQDLHTRKRQRESCVVSCEASLALVVISSSSKHLHLITHKSRWSSSFIAQQGSLSLSLSPLLVLISLVWERIFVLFWAPFLRLYCVVVSAHPEGAREQAFLLAPLPHQCRPYVLSPLLTICLPFDWYLCYSLLVVVVSVYRFLLFVLSVSFVRMLPGFFYGIGNIGAVVDRQISQSFIEVVRNVSTICISFL